MVVAVTCRIKAVHGERFARIDMLFRIYFQ